MMPESEGLILYKNKCVFNKSELELFGYIFSSKGLSADPKKINDFLKLDAPANALEVCSLLGMANYSSCLIPGYANLTAPLRELTRKDRQTLLLNRQTLLLFCFAHCNKQLERFRDLGISIPFDCLQT